MSLGDQPGSMLREAQDDRTRKHSSGQDNAEQCFNIPSPRTGRFLLEIRISFLS